MLRWHPAQETMMINEWWSGHFLKLKFDNIYEVHSDIVNFFWTGRLELFSNTQKHLHFIVLNSNLTIHTAEDLASVVWQKMYICTYFPSVPSIFMSYHKAWWEISSDSIYVNSDMGKQHVCTGTMRDVHSEEFLLWLCPSSIRCFLCVIACMYKTGNTNR